MHQVILDHLEEYLSRSPRAGRREFTAHLEECQECRAEVLEVQEICGVLSILRPVEPVEPAAGFYARMASRLESQRRPTIWSLLSLDPSFGRRVVFASLMTFAILGTYLIAREVEYSPGPTGPVVIMSQRGPSSNRDMMLATLASYEP
jgi:anti-sigma factor RsiW